MTIYEKIAQLNAYASVLEYIESQIAICNQLIEENTARMDNTADDTEIRLIKMSIEHYTTEAKALYSIIAPIECLATH